MSDVNFLILTAVAAIAFAFALLGVMTQWLKADEQSSALEGVVQRKLSDDPRESGVVMATSAQAAELPLGSADVSTADRPAAAASADAVPRDAALAVTQTEALESYIARHLIAWGGAATALGMLTGWFVGSFAGAIAGATVGTVLGVLAGTAVAALKRAPR